MVKSRFWGSVSRSGYGTQPRVAALRRYPGKEVAKNEVKSIAAIRSQIFDKGEISGRYTEQSALDIADTLNSGALPAPVKVVYEGPGKPKKGSQ